MSFEKMVFLGLSRDMFEMVVVLRTSMMAFVLGEVFVDWAAVMDEDHHAWADQSDGGETSINLYTGRPCIIRMSYNSVQLYSAEGHLITEGISSELDKTVILTEPNCLLFEF